MISLHLVYLALRQIGDVAICVSVKTTRVNVVNNLKKATVKVFEYYNPGNGRRACLNDFIHSVFKLPFVCFYAISFR